MKELVKTHKIEMAIIAVPIFAAQKVADELVENGIRAILNFASIHLKAPPNVMIKNENTVIEIEALSYFLANSG